MTNARPDDAPRVTAAGLAEGDLIADKYRIDRVIGAGGMGTVWSATHLELEAPVAIKVMRDEFAQSDEVVARMLFEARAIAKLRSSHVVRVLDVAKLPSGAPYIVMERLEGSDLATLLAERGPLFVEEAVDYVLQACEGLVEAHGLGIVHRDLKPENLFRASTREGFVVKVLDFGISKATGAVKDLSPRSVMTNAGLAVGSPYYMSPEQMRAQDVDARADIWSLGAILFELTSGRAPFEGATVPLVCAAVLSDVEAPALGSFAPELQGAFAAVVARCLDKDRDGRFRDVGELAAALKPFASLEGQRVADRASFPLVGGRAVYRTERATSTPAPMATPSEPEHRLPQPKRRYGVFAGALALLAVAALVLAARRNASPAPSAAKPGPAPIAAAAPTPAAASENEAPIVAASALPVIETPTRAVKRPASAKVVAAPVESAAPAPAASAASTASKPAPAVAKPDAFDVDRFGGRY